MPLKLFKRRKRDGSFILHYRGTINGLLIRGSTGTADRKIAARIAFEAETAANEGRLDGPKKGLTFPQAVDYYLKAHLLHPRERKYLARILTHWGKRALVKNMTAGAIRQSAIDIHPNDTGATRNRQVITPTQAVINHCAELDLCAPVRVRRFEVEQKIKQPVTLEWIDAFCAAADPQTAALAIFLFATGCRISEARRLKWDDIDFIRRVVLVRQTKTKSQRLPHMPNRLLIALANLPRDAAPFGRPETMLRRAWDRAIVAAAEAAGEAGFPRLTFHCCRHGFATTLLQSGKDVATVAKLGGWNSPHQVLATYAHAIQDATLTDGLFDTQLARGETTRKKINGLE
jgi:integrase